MKTLEIPSICSDKIKKKEINIKFVKKKCILRVGNYFLYILALSNCTSFVHEYNKNLQLHYLHAFYKLCLKNNYCLFAVQIHANSVYCNPLIFKRMYRSNSNIYV